MNFWKAYLNLRAAVEKGGYDSFSKGTFGYHYNKVNHNARENDAEFLAKAIISRILWEKRVSHTTDMKITLNAKTIFDTNVLDADTLVEYAFKKSKSIFRQNVIKLDGISKNTTIGELKEIIKQRMKV